MRLSACKVFSVFFIFLFLAPLVSAEAVSSSYDAFEDAFLIRSISGSVSDATPTLTWDTTKEYYTFTVTFTPSGGNTTLEIPIPDCYMGMDIWEGATLKTGNANYTLSVPWSFNETSPPPKDWNTGTLATPTGEEGILKRVQLYSSNAAETALTVRVYYATAPAVGFDGVNDYVDIVSSSSYTTLMFDIFEKPLRTGVEQYWMADIVAYKIYFKHAGNPVEKIQTGSYTDGSVWVQPYLELVASYEIAHYGMVVNDTYVSNYKNDNVVTEASKVNTSTIVLNNVNIGRRWSSAGYCKTIIYNLSFYNTPTFDRHEEQTSQ